MLIAYTLYIIAYIPYIIGSILIVIAGTTTIPAFLWMYEIENWLRDENKFSAFFLYVEIYSFFAIVCDKYARN